MKAICKVLSVLMIWFALTGSAQACRFIPDTRPLAERIPDYETVFVGKIMEAHIQPGTGESAAVIHIEKSIKGKPVEGENINIESNGGSCAHNFQKGEIWLIASRMKDSPYDSQMVDATFMIQDRDGNMAERWEEINSLTIDKIDTSAPEAKIEGIEE